MTGKLTSILGLTGLLASLSVCAQPTDGDQAAVAAVLDAYHAAAAVGDWDTYFDLMSEDAVFLGTDAAERWPRQEFQAYASGRSGWVYHPLQRHINLTPDGASAWFDELLRSESFGTARGTGVLIRTPDGWKISQYHLTLPIPNDLIREITDSIKAYEAGNTGQ
jgi:ketosteroid isomerase-like protein